MARTLLLQLFDGRAVVQNARAVKKQHVLRVKLNEIAEHRRGEVADIDERDLAVALREQRYQARGEGITEHDELPLCFSVRIFDAQQRLRPREEDFVGVVPRGFFQRVNGEIFAAFVVVHAAALQRVVCEIRERVGLHGQR